MRETLNETEMILLREAGFDYFPENKIAFRKVDDWDYFTAVTWTSLGENPVLWIKYHSSSSDYGDNIETYATNTEEIMQFVKKCLEKKSNDANESD